MDKTQLYVPDGHHTKTNKYRFAACNQAMNQAEAVVFLAVGIHFDHNNTANTRVVITGAEWCPVDKARELLQEALFALDEKLLADAQKPKL
jgi:hypothetical protein